MAHSHVFLNSLMKTFAPLTNIESVLSILSQISFFGGISDAEREEVFRLLESGCFKKGEHIIKLGEEPTHLYIIKSGRVDLFLTDDGGTIKERQFQAGDCFGEVLMLSMADKFASYVAAEDCELIVLSRRALNQLRHEDLHLFCLLIMNLAREIARKLQFTDAMLLKDEHALGR